MNRPVSLASLCVALLASAGTAFAANAQSTVPAPATSVVAPRAPVVARPEDSPEIDRILTAMNNASTWGHPDLFGEFSGMRLYSEGRYKDAIKYFKIGARYADKPSQLAIGLMYANGHGVKKDPVEACAWLALAAQRGYPNFVVTRNRVCNALTSDQHTQAEAKLAKLLPVYGDKIAKRRMTFALRQARMEMTGSRTGFDYGIQYMPISWLKGAPKTTNCNGPTMLGTSIAGCGGEHFWDADRWDPKRYFAARDAEFRATVTVGNLEEKHPTGSSSGTKNTSHKSPPASTTGSDH